MRDLQTNTAIIIAAIVISISIIAGLYGISLEKKSDYITVGGQSEVVIKPDRAIIYLTITTLEDTAQQTQEENNILVEKVKNALKEKGIENVETSSYYLNERVDWSSEGPVPKGYELMHTLKIVTELSEASDAITTSVANGVNNVGSIEFLMSTESKDIAVAEAMKQATLTAKEKAKKVVEASGSKLGRTLKIEEGSWWIMPSSSAPFSELDIPTEYQSNMITPQLMAVQANVNAVFEVK